MAIKAKMLGREAVTRRLRRLVPDAEKEAASAQLEAAQELATAIEQRAPLGESGDYRASIEGGRLADKPQNAVFGSSTKDPNATGIFADYIWRFLEFGTVKMAAQPHIFPTYRAMKKRIRRKVAGAINKAVRKAKS
ncbi:HK97 gp10 family phage protein [Aminobacter sp. NyZ550]|uniref:HK97-gp10 family putative phage morphogenesis protein n=1 Tax=Aminobacter sp. NyZ550 TaxID=2979870 RepID=UPI0021D5DE74|nr:HK97-gp10 family putative phage morphogenesis protein [Aminobacter sp. NyZ550]WAX93194.1 HK97 gp10 family phage protein [Aminobacter sp. NyZ550]